jgi:hypothetical protein
MDGQAETPSVFGHVERFLLAFRFDFHDLLLLAFTPSECAEDAKTFLSKKRKSSTMYIY